MFVRQFANQTQTNSALSVTKNVKIVDRQHRERRFLVELSTTTTTTGRLESYARCSPICSNQNTLAHVLRCLRVQTSPSINYNSQNKSACCAAAERIKLFRSAHNHTIWAMCTQLVSRKMTAMTRMLMVGGGSSVLALKETHITILYKQAKKKHRLANGNYVRRVFKTLSHKTATAARVNVTIFVFVGIRPGGRRNCGCKTLQLTKCEDTRSKRIMNTKHVPYAQQICISYIRI